MMAAEKNISDALQAYEKAKANFEEAKKKLENIESEKERLARETENEMKVYKKKFELD